MRWHARTMVPVGLGVGLILAGVAAAALWIHRVPGASRVLPARVVSGAEEPAPRLTPQDVEALKAEVKRLHTSQEAGERRSAAMSRELTALRTQLLRVDRDQAAIGREMHQRARAGPAAIGREMHQRARAGPAGDHAAEAPALTPDEASAEDEYARAEAQTQAQIEAFEGTLVEEDADPGWASAVQRALQEALHSETMAGLHLVQVDCRTSLCRLELAFAGARSPGESLEQLIHFASWEGAGFAQIDEASATAVVYLFREGYALPQARE